jgi:hypothetical protein
MGIGGHNVHAPRNACAGPHSGLGLSEGRDAERGPHAVKLPASLLRQEDPLLGPPGAGAHLRLAGEEDRALPRAAGAYPP